FFQQAVKNDPASAEALYGLGSAFLQQNKSKEAGDCFEKALHLHARYPGTLPNAWNNLGILAARERNTAAAIQHFQHALQIDPQHAIALKRMLKMLNRGSGVTFASCKDAQIVPRVRQAK